VQYRATDPLLAFFVGTDLMTVLEVTDSPRQLSRAETTRDSGSPGRPAWPVTAWPACIDEDFSPQPEQHPLYRHRDADVAPRRTALSYAVLPVPPRSITHRYKDTGCALRVRGSA